MFLRSLYVRSNFRVSFFHSGNLSLVRHLKFVGSLLLVVMGILHFSVHDGDISLGSHPFACLTVGQSRPGFSIYRHLSHDISKNDVFLTSLTFHLLSVLLSSLDVLSLAVEEVSLTLLSHPYIILQTVFHEQSSGHWVHGLTVHLLNVLDVRANRNLVSRLDKANVRDDAHLPHFLDSVSYFPLDGGA